MRTLLIALSTLVISAFSQGSFADSSSTFTGKFENQRGQITLTETAGSYSLSFLAETGSTDLIGMGCNSNIGAAKSVKVKEGALRKVVFAFSSQCPVQGRELVVEIKENTARLSVFEYMSTIPICHYDHLGRSYCHDQHWPNYLTGKFTN